jgi:PAS domain S-box-containing protein
MHIMRIKDKDIRTSDIFEVIIENFPDIIHSLDNEGNIIMTNKKAESLLGYTQEEMLGMNIGQIYDDEILEDVEKGFESLKKTGEKSVESALKDRYGNLIPVEIRSFSIYDDDGKFMRTFSILRDIRKVKELQGGLIHAERLAAIGELATGIVHDINNPLTYITLCNDLILQKLQNFKNSEEFSTEHIESAAQNIEKACAAIQKLVDHLKNFARKMPEKPRLFDLYESINGALFLMQSKTRKAGVEVVNSLPQGVHLTIGGAHLTEQVFANLISNACDAMTEDTERRLTITVTPSTRRGKKYWRCDVIDTGVGIPKDLQQEIFNPFYTTKEKGKGTGLGLSIVRGIVKDHDGDMEVVSEPGKGSIFSVYLPKAGPTEMTENGLYVVSKV